VKRLIVNADDFGLTRGVSEGILAAHRHGLVTSTTALVNRAIPDDLLGRARDSGMGIGLHVNFTLGEPLTRGKSLVDAAGRFVRDARHAAARVDARDVAAEIEAQVERFERLFRRAPSHLDSHHHIGQLSPVREALTGHAVQRRLPVRSQDERARAGARAAGLRTTDHFFGESGPDAYWALHRTLAALRGLPDGSSEFMSHPGYCDEELSYSRYGRQRETEMVGLGSSAARAAAMALGIVLCDFREI
jgi:predicted glycoside hydrolase/deacetylase ChbG (UPF0249 family)